MFAVKDCKNVVGATTCGFRPRFTRDRFRVSGAASPRDTCAICMTNFTNFELTKPAKGGSPTTFSTKVVAFTPPRHWSLRGFPLCLSSDSLFNPLCSLALPLPPFYLLHPPPVDLRTRGNPLVF